MSRCSNSSMLKLQSENKIKVAKKSREISRVINDDINELVERIDDYSVYNLFEPLILLSSCNFDDDHYQSCYKVITGNEPILNEMATYRRKVYHLLKDSGYDDLYVEDNIEKYTIIVISFYKNYDKVIDFLTLYNNLVFYEKSDMKVKCRHIDM